MSSRLIHKYYLSQPNRWDNLTSLNHRYKIFKSKLIVEDSSISMCELNFSLIFNVEQNQRITHQAMNERPRRGNKKRWSEARGGGETATWYEEI